ncbi:MAG: hypothetical protein K6F93_06825 [Lachnospiraceae bacterium]|nr:hypothetical protein [Lachnospiraceae bacterium]
MKKSILSLLLVLALILSACSSEEPEKQPDTGVNTAETNKEDKTDSGVQNTNADVNEPVAAEKNTFGFSMKVNNSDGKMQISRAVKSNVSMGDDGVWTIFVYLCGTDLESGGAAATGDVAQMLESQGSDNVRFIIQTGGTSTWNNEMFAQGKAERYIVQNGDINLVDTVELTNMGDPGTLASFLKWGVNNYPSEKMGLVFWDHGGGSITGVCVDELFGLDTLYLSEINTALSSVYEDMTDKFEFIGFDCCLMGTAETANILATYARYMYGSQETEPGSGWNYTAISDYLVSNPSANGAELGKALADSFYEECRECGQESMSTMTVVDLSKLDDFIVAFNDYAGRLYEACQNEDTLGAIVRCIAEAENFGGNNKSEGYTNMVDIGGIVDACKEYADPGNVKDALKQCISYNKNGSSHRKASGLSVYYPLQIQGSNELKVFSGITISPYYMSIADMVATGYTDNGYSNTVFFTDDGEWSNENCEYDYFDTEYFDYADEEDDGLSELITFEEEPFVNEDNIFEFTLDENGIAWATSVCGYIQYKIDDVGVELGETVEVNGDWETGRFEDGFDGYWYSLPDGQLLATYVVGYDEDEDKAIYTSPVLVNGERTNLRFTLSDSDIEVVGTWDGIDEDGMAAREIKKLKDGDVIVPIYFYDIEGSEEYEADEEYVEGDEYEWDEDDELTYSLLEEGDYMYLFFIEDAYGDFYVSPYVEFNVDENGEVFYLESDDSDEHENDDDDDYEYDDDYEDWD